MVEHPTGKVPKKVVILGLGPTKLDFVNIMASSGSDAIEFDEVWGVNTAGACLKVDVSFAMDDYLFCRGKLPNQEKFFQEHDGPIFTSVPRKDCPTALEYPLAEVLMLPGARSWLNHTVPYMIAYAALIGVEELILFGTDYISGDARYGSPQEQGNLIPRYVGCTSFWLGLCAGRGMAIVVTPSSPLLGADHHSIENFYGYLVQPKVSYEAEPVKPHLVEKDVANG